MSVVHQAAPRTTNRAVASTLTLTAGLLFAVVPILVELVAGELFALMGVALLLLVLSLSPLRALQAGRDGRAGRWGVRLVMAGGGSLVLVLVLGELLAGVVPGAGSAAAENGYAVVGLLGAASVLAGVVLFSVGLTRARVLSAPGIWVFLLGMATGLVSESFEQSLAGPVPWLADLLPPVGFVVAGMGLLVLGRSARRVERRGSGERVG